MNQQSKGRDQRKFPRLLRQVPLEVRPLSGNGQAPEMVAAGKDISGGGMRFTAARSYPSRTRLMLKIRLMDWSRISRPGSVFIDDPDNPPVNAVAEVVWCLPAAHGGSFEVGIRFLDIDREEYRALMDYLEKGPQ